ncbi:serpin B3-like [Mya arenaria]|uniref:serpin B3-like n=1 Tax=Mya arenaria TaxID=6604 RepID=UPI0022E62D56|nr:serpin B3-like [Mya arenaria]
MASALESAFTWKLYQNIAKSPGNILLSPHSVCSALMLACLGARGDTAAQIAATLGLPGTDPAAWHRQFSDMCEQLKGTESDSGVLIAIANKLFARLDIKVINNYSSEATKLYSSGTEPMDFASKPDESRIAINQWVEEQTSEKIKDLLQAGTINGATAMVLANAIYFKGKWDKPFDVSETKSMDFYTTATNKVKADMMRKKFDLRYISDDSLGLSAVEIPYQNQTMSMVIIRPNDVDGLSFIEGTLQSDALHDLISRLLREMKMKVDLGLPKFTFTKASDLSRVLPQMGITDLFDPEKVNLSAMTSSGNHAISNVIHKSFIEVNEEGTEAAAATAMISRMMMMPTGEATFICDRPFLFFIVKPETNSVLFVGRFSSP